MTGIDDDLATLHGCIQKLSAYEQEPEVWLSPQGQAALYRLETELTRLQESERIGEMRRIEGKRILDEHKELEAQVAALTQETERWMTPFDGSGIEWHESLPNPYTYSASDFSALVTAVHEYESRAQAAEAALADTRRALEQIALGIHDDDTYDALDCALIARRALAVISGGTWQEQQP